jgi:hypothetical protein
VTTTTPEPTAEKPVRGLVAAGIALAAHGLIFLIAYLIGQTADSGDGFQDLAAVAATIFLGEAIVGLAALIGGALVFRRGRRFTGLGLVGGWLLGLLVLGILFSG